MIAKFFRSYSVSYLRQEKNFRDHCPGAALAGLQGLPGPRCQLRLDNSSAAACASREQAARGRPRPFHRCKYTPTDELAIKKRLNLHGPRHH